jgi:hypothetical protein
VQEPSSSKQTFRGITSRIFRRLCKKASRMGIRAGGLAGNADKDGIRLRWNYDPDREQFDVECVGAPFWVNQKRVSESLRDEVEAILKEIRAA